MSGWHEFTNILILLAGALLLGAVADQLKQSPIVGYIIAGMAVGPKVFGFIGSAEQVALTAELGAALLLFTIGLEFSMKRLARLGWKAIVLGLLQICASWAAGAGAAMVFGLGAGAAFVAGAAMALSSTAIVLRLLSDNTLTDSVYGRFSTAILLMQDIAVVPLLLIVDSLAEKSGFSGTLLSLGRVAAASAGLFAAMYLMLNIIVPRILNLKRWSRNRELPILLAVVIAAGAAIAAHAAGISPAFGAFLAGMLLAESPFSVQIRADVSALRAVLVTLFFAAIGLYADPLWIMRNWYLVGGAALLMMVMKAVLVFLIMKGLKFRTGTSAATGLCVSQVGEFSFVIASLAAASGLLAPDAFRLLVSAAIITLVATPYIVKAAPAVARLTDPPRPAGGYPDVTAAHAHDSTCNGRVLIIGLGPAGLHALSVLCGKYKGCITVIDINPRNAEAARECGMDFQVGDARHAEVLEHAGVAGVDAVVLTLPDPAACREIVLAIKDIAPRVPVIVRSRYHLYMPDLESAGADSVVDEEHFVGAKLADEALAMISAGAVDKAQ